MIIIHTYIRYIMHENVRAIVEFIRRHSMQKRCCGIIQFFLQAGCSSCRPTNSVKALKRKYHIRCTWLPKLNWWGLPTLSLTTNSSRLPWGRVAMPLISPLMPVPLSLWNSAGEIPPVAERLCYIRSFVFVPREGISSRRISYSRVYLWT